MTTKNENYLGMGRTVNEVFTRYESLWSNNPRFKQEVTAFRGWLDKLSTIKSDSNIVTTGATIDKEEAGLALYDKAVNLGKRASVYALDSNNMELHDRLRTSRGHMSNMHDGLGLAKAKDIYNQLLLIKDKLVDYGISDAELNDFKTQLDGYETLINRPRDLTVERKGLNDSIPTMMNALRKSIYKLDSLINLFDESQFETDYKNARKVIDLGSRKDNTSGDTSPK